MDNEKCTIKIIIGKRHSTSLYKPSIPISYFPYTTIVQGMKNNSTYNQLKHLERLSSMGLNTIIISYDYF